MWLVVWSTLSGQTLWKYTSMVSWPLPWRWGGVRINRPRLLLLNDMSVFLMTASSLQVFSRCALCECSLTKPIKMKPCFTSVCLLWCYRSSSCRFTVFISNLWQGRSSETLVCVGNLISVCIFTFFLLNLRRVFLFFFGLCEQSWRQRPASPAKTPRRYRPTWSNTFSTWSESTTRTTR